MLLLFLSQTEYCDMKNMGGCLMQLYKQPVRPLVCRVLVPALCTCKHAALTTAQQSTAKQLLPSNHCPGLYSRLTEKLLLSRWKREIPLRRSLTPHAHCCCHAGSNIVIRAFSVHFLPLQFVSAFASYSGQ